ncbi:MAG: RNA polymerase sigma factor [Saprospiraceae bacterium]|jgi:RNA polymerase sigma factor (sigma-70 family)
MNDSEKWDLLRSGDKTAWSDIYTSEVTHLILYAKKLTPSVPIIEDAIQDLFVEIWQRKSALGPTDNIRKYLLVALRRKIFFLINKDEKKMSSYEPVENELPIIDSPESQLINWQTLEQRDSDIKKAIDNLSLRQKEIIHLKYSLGLDNKTISEIMGLSYQSTRNLLATSVRNLKNLLHFLIFLWSAWVQKLIF